MTSVRCRTDLEAGGAQLRNSRPTGGTGSKSIHGFTTTLTGISFDQRVADTTEVLKAEGFGVLSDIDVQAKMKNKPGIDMPPYRVLGAYNPALAHQALQAVPDIGLLLRCNVIVSEQTPERIVVGFLDPQIMSERVGNIEVRTVADNAEQRLRELRPQQDHRLSDAIRFGTGVAGDAGQGRTGPKLR